MDKFLKKKRTVAPSDDSLPPTAAAAVALSKTDRPDIATAADATRARDVPAPGSLAPKATKVAPTAAKRRKLLAEAAKLKGFHDPARVSGATAKKKKVVGGAAPRKKPAAAAKKSSSSKNKIAGKTLEQHRRSMGNVVKSNISVEKWCIEARTHCTIPNVEAEVFKQLIVANAASVVPAWDDVYVESTPVVVASIKGTDKLANIFGATKIRGGTRMGSWSADKAECVYFPESKELRVWWTMR